MILPAVFVLMLFVVVILMITLDMTDHTLAALIGAAILLIYMAQIWPLWQPLMANYYGELALTHPEYEALAADYAALEGAFNLDTFAFYFIRWIDLGTIIVILSLMVITEIARDSGLFQFIAVNALKLSGGSPRKLLMIFCALTFAMSSVLATTALIVGPLTILACDALEQNPTPYLISNAMCGNVGGITTMISSVPCMLVAGATAYDFAWFVINLFPLGLMLLGITIFVGLQLFRKEFSTPRPQRVRDLMQLNAWDMVRDRGVFYRTAVLFIALIIGFVIFGSMGLSWLVALVGCLVFIVFSGVGPERLFREVEWTALFFFIGLFMIVGGMEEFGVLHAIGEGIATVVGSNQVLATVMLLWVTGMTSGAVDNIPVTATLIPVVGIVGEGLPTTAIGTLYGSLVVGAVLGGALTPIASAANVLTMTVAKKEGRPIPYNKFLMTGAVLFFIFLGVTTGYMLFRLAVFPLAAPPTFS
ncbi:MAG: SLC13 family permease [Promethearchaeota archaeon]